MAVLSSLDNMIAGAQSYGLLNRMIFLKAQASNTTAATITSGYITSIRHDTTYTVPAFGGGVTSAYFITAAVGAVETGSYLVGLEYLMGSINLATGTFTDGSAMPTKVVDGASLQTAASIVMMCIDTAANIAATTPIITLTYTDQDGNTGASAALTLPTNSIRSSAFHVSPHFASGDTGVRDITNITKNAGTSGTINVYGILPISLALNSVATVVPSGLSSITTPLPIYPAIATEVISVYKFANSNNTRDGLLHLVAVGEL